MMKNYLKLWSCLQHHITTFIPFWFPVFLTKVIFPKYMFYKIIKCSIELIQWHLTYFVRKTNQKNHFSWSASEWVPTCCHTFYFPSTRSSRFDFVSIKMSFIKYYFALCNHLMLNQTHWVKLELECLYKCINQPLKNLLWSSPKCLPTCCHVFYLPSTRASHSDLLSTYSLEEITSVRESTLSLYLYKYKCGECFLDSSLTTDVYHQEQYFSSHMLSEMIRSHLCYNNWKRVHEYKFERFVCFHYPKWKCIDIYRESIRREIQIKGK